MYIINEKVTNNASILIDTSQFLLLFH